MGIATSFDVATSVPRGTAAVGVGVFRTARGMSTASRSAAHPKPDLAFLEARGFTAKPGEAQALPAGSGRVLVALGLGEQGSLDAEVLRKAGAALARSARVNRVAIVMSGLARGSLDAAGSAQAVAEGVALAAYEFRTYKSGSRSLGKTATPNGSDTRPKVERLTLVGAPSLPLAAGIDRAGTIASAVGWARDMVNEPAGSLPPVAFAEKAADLMEATGIEVEVWDEDRIAMEHLGGVLGVSAGSVQPPRFLRLSYRGAGRTKPAPVALVGKGVCFDSGGLSLKTASGMETMKTDMSGAAAVVAGMAACAGLAVNTPLVGYVPLVENMPGGRAIKPGDVVIPRNGTTVEVLNTDAEGRLILADALSLAAESSPQAIVDLATLTGACTIALGDRIAGLMGTGDTLLGAVESASRRSGELVWRMPLPGEYRKHIDSDIADIKNIGASGGLAGSLTAGLFLKEFAGSGPWVHLDIAGPARSSTDESYIRKGGTGFGVRLLVELLETWQRSAGRMRATTPR